MTLIFDYDGTLHDTARLYGCAFRKAYSQLVESGYAEDRYLSDLELSRYLGMNADEMWLEFMPDLPRSIREETALQVGKNMVDLVPTMARLYDGAEQALLKLHSSRCNLVILSNCHDAYMDAHRERFSLDNYFSAYFTAESCGNIKKSDVVPLIMSRFPDDLYITIGDRASDIEAGRANRLPTIGCTYGFAADGELQGCTAYAHSPSEIFTAVETCILSFI